MKDTCIATILTFVICCSASCEGAEPVKRDLLVQNEIGRIILHLPKMLESQDITSEERSRIWTQAVKEYSMFMGKSKSDLVIQAILGVDARRYKDSIRTGKGMGLLRRSLISYTYSSMNDSEKRELIKKLIPQLVPLKSDAIFQHFSQEIIIGYCLDTTTPQPTYSSLDEILKEFNPPPDVLVMWLYVSNSKAATITMSRVYGKNPLTEKDFKELLVDENFSSSEKWWEQLYFVYTRSTRDSSDLLALKQMSMSKFRIVRTVVQELLPQSAK